MTLETGTTRAHRPGCQLAQLNPQWEVLSGLGGGGLRSDDGFPPSCNGQNFSGLVPGSLGSGMKSTILENVSNKGTKSKKMTRGDGVPIMLGANQQGGIATFCRGCTGQ